MKLESPAQQGPDDLQAGYWRVLMQLVGDAEPMMVLASRPGWKRHPSECVRNDTKETGELRYSP